MVMPLYNRLHAAAGLVVGHVEHNALDLHAGQLLAGNQLYAIAVIGARHKRPMML